VIIEGPVVVGKRGESRILRGHPWIFRSDVIQAEGTSPGAVVRVRSQHGRHLGFALFSSRSEIRLRMIERGDELPETFLQDRLTRAFRWRDTIAKAAMACRLVHGEGDGLPSVILDRYGDYLVLQTLSEATERWKDEIVSILVDLLHPRGILERNDPRVRSLEGLESKVGVLHGDVPQTVEIEEGGYWFEADLWKGQKTGLFLDQRENHGMVSFYARGRALDGFAYNGGFTLPMARVASEVVAVDVSADALARLRTNAERNGLNNITPREGNLFDILRAFYDEGERFDTIVLDPPAFAKSKASVPKAERGYKEINLRGLKILRPEGCLITCSCSYHVHEADLERILASAAVDAGATVTIVEKRGQARDHPIVLGVPETYYLKCFVLRKL